jgi:hypothetical protein
VDKLTSICVHSYLPLSITLCPLTPGERTIRYPLDKCDWLGPIFGPKKVVKFLYLEEFSIWCIAGNSLKVEGSKVFPETEVTGTQFTQRTGICMSTAVRTSNVFTMYFAMTCSVR